MPFEKFESSGRSYTPQITISEGGYINFNAGTCRRFSIPRFSHVLLYFDPETERIGFEFTNDGELAGARKLQHRKPSAGLYAEAFLEFYDIDHQERRAYDPKVDEETGYLVIGPVPTIDVQFQGAAERDH